VCVYFERRHSLNLEKGSRPWLPGEPERDKFLL